MDQISRFVIWLCSKFSRKQIELISKELEEHSLELPRIEHHAVIGLQNLDKESETCRAFKQLIERLNRTFKFHVRPASGFKSDNGTLSLIVLFATHYNFLRPHISLSYRTPVEIPELQDISTIQGKWIKILSMSEA